MSVNFKKIKTIHHFFMARYLRKRGWVVFYLEEKARHCLEGECWLKEWKNGKG